MADIHSATAEIRRGKKEERTNDRMKIFLILCPIPSGDHNNSVLTEKCYLNLGTQLR